MIAECYDLSVQCDNNLAHVLPVRASFNGPNRRYCWAVARRAGWRIAEPDTAICPTCVKKAKARKEPA